MAQPTQTKNNQKISTTPFTPHPPHSEVKPPASKSDLMAFTCISKVSGSPLAFFGWMLLLVGGWNPRFFLETMVKFESWLLEMERWKEFWKIYSSWLSIFLKPVATKFWLQGHLKLKNGRQPYIYIYIYNVAGTFRLRVINAQERAQSTPWQNSPYRDITVNSIGHSFRKKHVDSN